MTRRRWIADEVSGDTAALVGEHALHLTRVLRAKVGQEFDIASGDAVRRGKITSISGDRVEFALGVEQAVCPAPHVTLVLAIFKFDRMEWAIEKCTEIGVARVIPVIARRTETHLASAAMKRHERWQRIALQAAEQSRRAAPPEIAFPVKLKDLGSAGVSPAGGLEPVATARRIVLAESQDDRLLREALQARPDR
jgi:16S rRNA (uracil1498-N3)-methyltransferase